MMHQLNYVNQKDRDQRTNEIRGLFNLLGFKLTYIQVDVLVRAMDVYEKKGGKTDLRDGSQLIAEWEQRWENYFSKKEEEKP